MKTILITGSSSGYGLETARYFLSKGWNVIATMRKPREDLLPRSPLLRVLPLDVTDDKSIEAAIAAAGPIDVLVNNAGLGVVGAFEATPMPHIRKVFETNTFGVMAMCQAVLGHHRQRNLQCDPRSFPAGRRIYRQQAGHRRFHRFAGARTRALRHPGQAG